MNKEISINKVEITQEAVFDYENCLEAANSPSWAECLSMAGGDEKAAFAYAGSYERPLRKLDKKALKREVEEYIDNLNKSGILSEDGYFRCRYYDAQTYKTLTLFFYKGYGLGIMQFWMLAGICEAEDWSGDAEACGEIRSWLRTKTDDPPEEEDWVVGYRVKQILQNTETLIWEEVLEEVKGAFKCERDKEVAEKLLFLQKFHFVCRKTERVKRKARPRR
jgi:hypothetical protein